MYKLLDIRLLLVITVTSLVFLSPVNAGAIHAPDILSKLKLPEGFRISVFADNLRGPRLMSQSPDGVLHVTLTRAGMVMALPDMDRDGIADKKVTVASGLDNPHGIAFHNGYVYIAETGRVIRYTQDSNTLKLKDKNVIVKDLHTNGGGHFTRTLAFGPDGLMYVSVGSSCNICLEEDRRRAAVLRFNPDGSNGEIYAEGLRNTVGLIFHPVTGELYGTDNGRDWLGENLPPDEVNIIKEGAHYGWPYCYSNKIIDPEHNRKMFCGSTTAPSIELQAHSAPLGLTFYTGSAFPEKYRGRLFIAFHGSWNRSEPTGYKVVSAATKGGKPVGTYEDFISGWQQGREKLGRPVDVFVADDGALLISDDGSGYIYRVTYKKK